jgi:hypothetical protein
VFSAEAGPSALYAVQAPARSAPSDLQGYIGAFNATLDLDPGTCCKPNGIDALYVPQSAAFTKYFATLPLISNSTGDFKFYLGRVPTDPATGVPCRPLTTISLGQYTEGGNRQYSHTYSPSTSCAFNGGRAEVIAVFSERGTTFGNISFEVNWTGTSPRMTLNNAAGSGIANCRVAFNNANRCIVVDLASGGSSNINVSNGLFFVVVRTLSSSPSGTWTLSW